MVVTAACAGLLVAACSATAGVKTAVVFPGADHPAGMAVPAVDSHNIVTAGTMILCLTGPLAPATITAVTPYKGNGHLEVVAFAVRPNPLVRKGGVAVGTSLKSLSALGFQVVTRPTVSVPCQTTKSTVTNRTVHAGELELAVTFRRMGDVTGSDQGTDVHYVVDGTHKQVIDPLSVTLCGSNDRSEDCS